MTISVSRDLVRRLGSSDPTTAAWARTQFEQAIQLDIDRLVDVAYQKARLPYLNSLSSIRIDS